jgi:antibiotic biosynthesis monooxygenase (ABM) superfamily enzyme
MVPIYILVRLWIRKGREVEFEAYEHKVSQIMARYGGVIERVIRPHRIRPAESELPFEVHVLRFPTQKRYEAYEADADRTALSAERAAAIMNSEVVVGAEGPTYSAKRSV